jgi:hypothetical protein
MTRLKCLLLLVAVFLFPVPGNLTAAEPGPTRAPDAKELEVLWADLAEADAARAYQAICRLAMHPDVSAPFLRVRLRPARPVAEKTIARLVAQLDSENFDEREKAQKELDGFGDPVRVYLRAALDSAPSPETKRRLETVLQHLDEEVLSSESLRNVRAVEALERMGTAEARFLAKELAGGAPGARLTREAQSSLARMTANP